MKKNSCHTLAIRWSFNKLFYTSVIKASPQYTGLTGL